MVRERPSLPADVTVSERLYMLTIRAPSQGESEGGEKREKKVVMEGHERSERRAENSRPKKSGKKGRKGEMRGEESAKEREERQCTPAARGGGERGGSILMGCELLAALFSFIWSIWLKEFNKRRANDLTRYPVISTDETPSLLDSL